MKRNIIFLGLLVFVSVTHAEYAIIGRSECVDKSKVNNKGSIQVKVLADIYESEKASERGLTLSIQDKNRMYFQRTLTLSNPELNKGKDKTLTLEANSGVGAFRAKVIVSAQSGNHPKAQIVNVSQHSNYSA